MLSFLKQFLRQLNIHISNSFFYDEYVLFLCIPFSLSLCISLWTIADRKINLLMFTRIEWQSPRLCSVILCDSWMVSISKNLTCRQVNLIKHTPVLRNAFSIIHSKHCWIKRFLWILKFHFLFFFYQYVIVLVCLFVFTWYRNAVCYSV